MPETLKKLREPAALAAVVFAGLVVLVGIINLLAPPGNGAAAVPFSDRAFDQATGFLSLDVAAAVAFAVYLANHAGPAVAKARVITLAALIEVGLAALFGVVSALALFGASGVDGESKFLRFLVAVGGAAVVAVAGLFTWLTWQELNPATNTAGNRPAGAFVGGNWPSGPSGAGGGAGAGGNTGGPSGQQYGQHSPPPGGFGWSPQQSPQQPSGQSSPTVFGQQSGQVPGQSAGYGQPSPQGAPGAPQPFGADRTQMLPPVQSGQPGQQGQLGQPGQQGQPPSNASAAQSPFGQPPQSSQPPTQSLSQPGAPTAPSPFGQPGQPGTQSAQSPSAQSPFGQPPQPDASFAPSPFGHQGQSPAGAPSPQSPFGQPPQAPQPGQHGQPGYGGQASQAPQPPQLGQQIGQATVVSGSGTHQAQPPLPPTMQGYAAEHSPWSPGGPGTGGAGTTGGQQGPGQHATTGQQQQGQQQPGQQPPQARPEDGEQRPGPFQIGDWRSE